MSSATPDNGIYYFLGNIPSHILHALPLYKELGGTFVVLSKRAEKEVRRYDVPVVALDNKPWQWQRFGYRLKPVPSYLEIGANLQKTTDFLNSHAKVVLFYDLYDFAPEVRLTKPETVFLTHGNMLKNYMANGERLELLKHYDYMAALGPYLKKQFIEHDHIDPAKLVDLGIARTDEIVAARGGRTISPRMVNKLSINTSRPVFSYLPTFWGASSIYTVGKEIVRNFPAEFTLLFRPHPQTPAKLLRQYLRIIKAKPNVKYVPEGLHSDFGLLDIYRASSAIIGDVSSVMLEAILLEKPLLFAYDSGEHRQSESDYDAIKEVVSYSQRIDLGTIGSLAKTLQIALDHGIDETIWRQAEDRTFFHHDGTSVAAIANFVKSRVG